MFRILTAAMPASAAFYFFETLRPPTSWLIATGFAVFARQLLTTHTVKKNPGIVRLRGSPGRAKIFAELAYYG